MIKILKETLLFKCFVSLNMKSKQWSGVTLYSNFQVIGSVLPLVLNRNFMEII